MFKNLYCVVVTDPSMDNRVDGVYGPFIEPECEDFIDKHEKLSIRQCSYLITPIQDSL